MGPIYGSHSIGLLSFIGPWTKLLLPQDAKSSSPAPNPKSFVRHTFELAFLFFEWFFIKWHSKVFHVLHVLLLQVKFKHNISHM